MSKDVMTLAELSQYLDLSPQQIQEKIKQQEIPYALVAQQLRFPKMAIDRWLEAQTVYPGSSSSYENHLSQALNTPQPKKRGPKPKTVEAPSAPAEEATTPVKRGPGRPRKQSVAPKKSPGRPKKDAAPKRGPGRPRKNAISADGAAPENTPAPSKRGRPKKEKTEVLSLEAPKAKRGRPKKEVVATDSPKGKRGRPKKSEAAPKKPGRPKKAATGAQRGPGRPRKQAEVQPAAVEELNVAVIEAPPVVEDAAVAAPVETPTTAIPDNAPVAAPKTSGPKPKPKRKAKPVKSKGKKAAVKAPKAEAAAPSDENVTEA